MKMLPKLMLAGAALASVHMASALTTIYITGSTAFRGATHSAILRLLDPSGGGTSVSVASGATFGYSGTGGLGKANAAIFKGTAAGDTLIIKCAWSGSVGGVQANAGSFQVNFPNSTDATASGTGASIADTTTDGVTEDLAVPDLNMSDTYQASTVFNNSFLSHSYVTLTDNIVGVVPFKWVATSAAPAGLNMTPQLAQATYVGAGQCPLALYTGNNADHNTLVTATGRDADSGTRLTALAETGIGVNTAVNQTDIHSLGPYAGTPIDGVPHSLGDGGESSGGTLATKFADPNAATNIFVAYFSTGDASSAITNGGKEMTYNGVAYSTTNVTEGKYSFWGYEHLMYKSGLGTSVPNGSTKLSFAGLLKNQILNTDATVSGILKGSMQVNRGSDGGTITATYF